MIPDTRQREEHSVETQQRLSEAHRYNKWIRDLISPYVTGRVLDIGSALGNIVKYFLDREALVSLDIEQRYVDYLNDCFSDHPDFVAHLCDASDSRILEILEPQSFDSVTCLNVIEHIPDDAAVCRHVFELLKPGGHFAVVAPALQWIYGSMDSADHHCRRYYRDGMTRLFENAGFQVTKCHYFNFVGVWGWWYYGRVLKSEYIPGGATLKWVDRILGATRKVENVITPPLGQSLVCVGRKPM